MACKDGQGVNMTCNTGDVINVLWNENVTFYGKKNDNTSNCSLKNDSAKQSVENITVVLTGLCDGALSCELKSTVLWMSGDYLQVSYTCTRPGNVG